jgi:hypothetical protein
LPTPISEGDKTPNGTLNFKNEIAYALRKRAAQERVFEEARLRKRRIRQRAEENASRQGSVPGTPGSIAPEIVETKAPTKKEQKKKAAAEAISMQASHSAANSTTAQFLGLGKKKKYSWMTGSAPGSGANTPGRIVTQGLAGSGVATANTGPESLTSAGSKRYGDWREDQAKGAGIQIRDWILVLERDGRTKKALQLAYPMQERESENSRQSR